jgi:hypothetical protein
LVLAIAVLAGEAAAQTRMITSGEVRCAIRSWWHPAGHHFYAPAAEGNPAGWTAENVRFVTFARRSSSQMVPLYRMFRPGGGHFYTSNEQERNALLARGFVNENHIGYVYPQPYADLVALYRWYKPAIDRHFYSTDRAEGDRAGFQFEGVIGYVRPASSAGQLEQACLISSLDANLPAPAPAPTLPSWVNRDERCFGAVGSGCGGFIEGVALLFNRSVAVWSLSLINTAAVGCISWGGQSACWVSSGSIKHDNCCVRNPNGVACGGNNSESTCSAEWDEAVRASARGRVWVQTFDSGRRADLTPVASPRNRYAVGEVNESARLCAPNGAYLDDNQVAFCCSGSGVKYQFMGDRWLQCTDRAVQNAGVIPADKPLGVLVPDQENMRKLLSGVPRDKLEVLPAKPAGR